METKKLPGFFELLQESLSFYKKHYKVLIGIGLVIVVLSFVEQLVRLPLIGGKPSVGFGIIVFFITAIFAVVRIVFFLLMQIGFIRAFRNLDEGTTPKLKDVYTESLPFFGSFILISILVYFITLGSAIFFIIPVIILGGYFIFVHAALVLDNKKGMQSLLTSFHYVEGYWWSVVWRGLALVLIITGFVIIAATILSVVYLSLGMTTDPKQLEELFSGLGGGVIAIVWTVIVTSIATCVITPITMHFNYSIYKKLKEFKSAPNFEDKEIQTRRKWFTTFGIIGIILAAVIIAFSIWGLTSIIQNPGGLKNIQTKLDIEKEVSPPIDTTFVIKNPAGLSVAPYSDKVSGFTLFIPKAWEPKVITDEGVIFKNPTQKEGELNGIIELQYFDKELVTEDMLAYQIAKEIEHNNPTLTDTKFGRLYIGARLSYVLSGKFTDVTPRQMRYYLVPAKAGTYIITASWRDSIDATTQTAILDAIASFKGDN